jgi:branched-chain amino acid transport system permease protein
VVGAIVIVFLPEVLRAVERYYLLLYGILLLVIVAYLPGGLWNLFKAVAKAISSLLVRTKVAPEVRPPKKGK